MSESAKQESQLAEIDAKLGSWRQGDCVLGLKWVVFRFEPTLPITPISKEELESWTDLAEQPVRGLVVITQTCDIVRACLQRPFLEVAPLVEVDENTLSEIKHGRRPLYAFLPALASQRLVADLDRVMTVEKPAAAQWDRVPGYRTDEEARRFSLALARKRIRFAFPDDFVRLAKKLEQRLKDKHDKNTPEGRALRALREIRVHASPQWDSESVEVMFWFIRTDGLTEFEGKAWNLYLQSWLKLIPATGRFISIEGIVVALEDMTARDYVESDPLDLDHLSLSIPDDTDSE